MVFGPEAAVLKLELELIVYLLTGSILRRGFCHSPANTYNLQQAHHIFFLLVNNNSVSQWITTYLIAVFHYLSAGAPYPVILSGACGVVKFCQQQNQTYFISIYSNWLQ